MNKKLIVIIILSLTLFSISISAEEKLFINADLKMLFPSDSNYKEVYDSTAILPEFKLGYFITGDIYLWAGAGFLSGEGTTPGLQEDAKSNQTFLSLGAGYQGMFSDQFGYTAGLGLCSISYKEEALGEEVTGTPLGFRLDGSVFYKLSKNFRLNFSLGYITASEDVDDISIKLGGFNAGFGIGVIL